MSASLSPGTQLPWRRPLSNMFLCTNKSNRVLLFNYPGLFISFSFITIFSQLKIKKDGWGKADCRIKETNFFNIFRFLRVAQAMGQYQETKRAQGKSRFSPCPHTQGASSEDREGLSGQCSLHPAAGKNRHLVGPKAMFSKLPCRCRGQKN